MYSINKGFSVHVMFIFELGERVARYKELNAFPSERLSSLSSNMHMSYPRVCLNPQSKVIFRNWFN